MRTANPRGRDAPAASGTSRWQYARNVSVACTTLVDRGAREAELLSQVLGRQTGSDTFDDRAKANRFVRALA
jgi:hypothetical protein